MLAADAAALTAGLRVGMPVAGAQVLVPGLVVRDADPADAEGLERLALWCCSASRRSWAADPPDGIVINSTGADHLHGGEQSMLDTLVGRPTLSGVAARAAVADSQGAAHALARYAARPTFVAPPGHGASVLARLPLGALRLPEPMLSDLRILGFERIGDLLAQPRAPLARRFGPELIQRIDQALGELAEPIEPVRPPALIEAHRAFAEPIGAAGTIARYIGKLAASLCATLKERGLGARRLDLLCQRVDNRTQAIRVGTARPVADVRRLRQALRQVKGARRPSDGPGVTRSTRSSKR